MSAALRFAVRVRPGASRVRVGGRHDGPRGTALIVAVTARAVDGQATEAALRAVAEALRVRRAAVRLVSGATARDKVLEIAEPAPDVRTRLDALLDSA